MDENSALNHQNGGSGQLGGIGVGGAGSGMQAGGSAGGLGGMANNNNSMGGMNNNKPGGMGGTGGNGQDDQNNKASPTQYSIPGILHFIQHEWARFELERSQWDVDRAELQVGSQLVRRSGGWWVCDALRLTDQLPLKYADALNRCRRCWDARLVGERTNQRVCIDIPSMWSAESLDSTRRAREKTSENNAQRQNYNSNSSSSFSPADEEYLPGAYYPLPSANRSSNFEAESLLVLSFCTVRTKWKLVIMHVDARLHVCSECTCVALKDCTR
ncbi:hypothetical protein RP20_CCG015209 [Aedes albopictus]|nr:hypothetical protein RP20_CCG015209 [Aedes albopictus]